MRAVFQKHIGRMRRAAEKTCVAQEDGESSEEDISRNWELEDVARAMAAKALASENPQRFLEWQLQTFCTLLQASSGPHATLLPDDINEVAYGWGDHLQQTLHFQVGSRAQDPRVIRLINQAFSALLASWPRTVDVRIDKVLQEFLEPMLEHFTKSAEISRREVNEAWEQVADALPKDEKRFSAVRQDLHDLIQIGQAIGPENLVVQEKVGRMISSLLGRYRLPLGEYGLLFQALFGSPEYSMAMNIAVQLAHQQFTLEFQEPEVGVAGRHLTHAHWNDRQRTMVLLDQVLKASGTSPRQLHEFANVLLADPQGYAIDMRFCDLFEHVCAIAESFEPGLRGRLRALLMVLPRQVKPPPEYIHPPLARPWDVLTTPNDLEDPAALRRQVMAFYLTRQQLAGVVDAARLEALEPLPQGCEALTAGQLNALREAACAPFELLEDGRAQDGKALEAGDGLDAAEQAGAQRSWSLFLEAMRLPGALVPATRQRLRDLLFNGPGLDARQRGELAELLLSCPQAAVTPKGFARLRAILLDAAEVCAARGDAETAPDAGARDKKGAAAGLSAARGAPAAAELDLGRVLHAIQTLYLRALARAGLRLLPDRFDAVATPLTRLQDLEAAAAVLKADQAAIEADIKALQARSGDGGNSRSAALGHALTTVKRAQEILADNRANLLEQD